MNRVLCRALRPIASNCKKLMVQSSTAVTSTTCTSASNKAQNMVPLARNFVTSSQFRMVASIDVAVPSMGDSISQGVLSKWMAKSGDAVAVDQVIAMIETDKITVEVKSPHAGVFVKAHANEGDEVLVGNPLFIIDSSATAAATPAAAPKAAATPAAATTTAPTPAAPAAATKSVRVDVAVPSMGDSISQGILSKWMAKIGDAVVVDQCIAMIETDKITVEVKAPHAGIIIAFHAQEGAEVLVGNPLFIMETGGAPAAAAPKAAAAPTPSPKAVSAPAAAAVPAAAPKAAAAPSAAAPKVASSPSPAASGPRTETRVKMTRMRQRIAQRLKESQNTAAMLTTFQEVDMTNLIDMRNKYKDDFEKVHGVKLGFMSAFVRAATGALQEIPAVNAVIDDKTDEIVYRSYSDISVAVASPTGLVVPVLRNTQNMSFADVEKTIAAYGKKAKEGSLALEDMAGGTFTISNGGVFGSLFGTPIINPPQSAILGMHATKLRPYVVNGKVEARPMMYIALTYDHRLIDGREAVTFLKSIANKIEDPSRLLLGV